MRRVAITGADGFVGRHVVRALLATGREPLPLVRDGECARRFAALGLDSPPPVIVGDIGAATDWSRALVDVDAVIHLAARVHVMRETAADPLEAFREVNTRGTERLAREAARLGVRRVVVVSTIKVNGESTTGRAPFSERDPAAPRDAYGISKWEAEQALAAVAAETGLETVIVRPPLVHGPGVGGNLLRLLELVRRGVPLPLATVRNRRSLIGVENLADLLVRCAEHPDAPGRVFTVSDGEDLSTAELVRELAAGMGRPARLVPAPLGLLGTMARLVGRGDVFDRLAGSLQVDPSLAREVLGWLPPVPAREGLRRMAAAFAREYTGTRG